mmetsp:Transcript_6960/g.29395  ORF Transcript_6960/g.29395 Transcript_6960/m.29395 type:complete len:534 (+) Transcript_6960:1797-3398(+)
MRRLPSATLAPSTGDLDELQPPQQEHHRGRGPCAQPLHVLRHGLPGERLRQADDRHRQRPLDDHALQLRPAKARRRGRHRPEGCGRQCPAVRHADHLRRHGHGYRGHEVFAGVARGHRRLRRDLRRRPMAGWRDGHRRLRQEHARRHDGHAARQCAGPLHLRRHDQARALQGPGSEHRQRLRGRGPVQRRQDERGRLLPDRETRDPRQRLLRRHVHREHHELGLRGAGHEPALLIHDVQCRGRGGREREEGLRGAGRGSQGRPEAARHRHQEVHRERRRRDHGHRRLDQCGAAFPGHRPRGGRGLEHRRLRTHAQKGPGAVRPQAQRPVPGGGPAQGRRHPGRDEGAAQGRPAAWRLHHHHRQDGGREPRRGARSVARAAGHPPGISAHLRSGSPGHTEGQPQPRGLRRQDHRAEESRHHRPGARVRRRAVGVGRHHGRQNRRRRRDGAALSRPQGRSGHARDAGTHRRADRPGTRRERGPDHRWPFLRGHLGHGGGPCGARGLRGRRHCPRAGGRHHHHRRPPAAAGAAGQR